MNIEEAINYLIEIEKWDDYKYCKGFEIINIATFLKE